MRGTFGKYSLYLILLNRRAQFFTPYAQEGNRQRKIKPRNLLSIIFFGRGNFENQKMYSKSVFTNSNLLIDKKKIGFELVTSPPTRHALCDFRFYPYNTGHMTAFTTAKHN
jgi:hypothetical protein